MRERLVQVSSCFGFSVRFEFFCWYEHQRLLWSSACLLCKASPFKSPVDLYVALVCLLYMPVWC